MKAHHNEQTDYIEKKEILQKNVCHEGIKKNNVSLFEDPVRG
jgi:hypothetical protein